ncbi:MAG: SOS response-associated peptidase family protein [Coriobacteriaceae bacterium]|jgi:putative SOS response-associated peptidase YedK|nr:SOS response-associated peptidase family protein [Coriobacteriaceae bacterium]
MCVQIEPLPRDLIDEVIQEVRAGRAINLMPDWPAVRPSAFPGSKVGLIVGEGGCMAPAIKQWGYRRPWSKSLIVNTRDDSALDPSKMWFESLMNRRCVIPVFGFFEPHRTEASISPRTGKPIKQQYLFTTPASPVTFIAGIYEGDCFSMMTTAPNATMMPIHDRMPLVLLQNELERWLCGDYRALFDRSAIKLDATRA